MTNYLGSQPLIGNFVKLDAISVVNGQAAYTMQNGGVNFVDYSTVNQFLVSLNGTIQSPGSSFTVSSSTITFSSNLSTGDVIDFIIVFGNSLSAGEPTDGTVSTVKIVDGAITSAKLASGVGGVAGITSSADANAITINSSEQVGIGTTSPTTPLEIRGSTPQLSIRDSSSHGSIISWHGGVDALGRHGIYYGSSSSNEVDINEYGDIYFSAGKTGGSNPHDGRKIKMDTGGNLLLLSGGLFLGGTGSANNLDDYEEGTFTPAFDSGKSGGSYDYQVGEYTKIGNICFFQIQIDGSAMTGTNTQLIISGLPFTSDSGSPYGGAIINYNANFRSDGDITAHVGASATKIWFYQNSGSSLLGIEATDINASLLLNGFYRTA
jgi:hypothetical protein